MLTDFSKKKDFKKKKLFKKSASLHTVHFSEHCGGMLIFQEKKLKSKHCSLQ